MPIPKKRHRLSDMEYDEISLVDKGANQDAMVVIAKRAPEEDQMPELYNEDGELLDENSLEFGDVVYDEEGNAYEFVQDDEVEYYEEEPELVGKSAFFEPQYQGGSDYSQSIMEELSKAFSDDDRDQVIAKALGRVEELEDHLARSAEIAKSERDLRLTREYIAKAAEYNVPVDPMELGPVLYRMAETMPYEDCAVIAKCLETSGAIFDEIGFAGSGDNADPMAQIEAFASETIGKAAGADDISAVLDSNPAAYDEYLAAQRGY